MPIKQFRLIGLLVFAILALAVPALAQMSLGVRGGVSAGPKQVFFGMHFESPGLTQTGHLTFRPNVEVGVGSGMTLLSGNLEVVYWVRFPGSKWSGYFGAGPSAVMVHQGTGGCPGCAGTSVGGGFNGLVGFQNDSGLFFELKRGDGPNPSLRLTVGYVLRKGKR